MGMDVYLWEIDDNGNEEVWGYGNAFVNAPKWLKDHMLWGEDEFVNLEKLVEDHGYTTDDISWWDGEVVRLWNGEELKIADDYVFTRKIPYVKVKLIKYARWDYTGDEFAEGMNPFFGEGGKFIKDFYWTPEEMKITRIIFKNPERWNEMMKKFEELQKEGRKVFVECSW